MGRKPTPVTAPAQAPKMNEAAFEVLAQNNNELALMQAQHESAVRAVATQIGYQLPADATDPDLIQRDIASNMRRSVEACLEVGRGLAVLKTACPHGNFLARLDVLGIDRTVSTRFIQAATKFSNVATSHHLKSAIGSQSKLFEMLVLDDEQLEELELTGQTGELKLDDVATMSVKELRHALRDERQTTEAKDRVLKDTKDRLTTLEIRTRKKIVADTDWPDAVAPLCDQIAAAGRKVAQGLSEMEACRIALFAAGEGMSEEELAKYQTAFFHVGDVYEEALSRAERNVQKERSIYDRTLGAYDSDEQAKR